MAPIELAIKEIEKAHSLEKIAIWLEFLLSDSLTIASDGTIGVKGHRQIVERLGALSISIRSREHAPPHFHVDGAGVKHLFPLMNVLCLKVA